MKLLFISDSTELRNNGRITAIDNGAVEDYVFAIGENNPATKKHLYDVAIEVKNKIPEAEPCIIFIDQYLSCADEGFEWLQRNAGIALVKFLRMLEVRRHIVLITPFAGKEIELIRQSPGNLIVTSKGISFARTLYEFCNKTVGELEELFKTTFDEKQDLKSYILTEFRLPEDERHNWANWWGIDRLWLAHHLINSDGSINSLTRSEIDNYPSSLIKITKELKNLQALFLYGQSDKNFLVKALDAKTKINELNEILIHIGDQQNQSALKWSDQKVKHSMATKAIEELTLISSMKKLVNDMVNSILDFSYIKENERKELCNKILNEENRINEIAVKISDLSTEKTDWSNQLNNIATIITHIKDNIFPCTEVISSLQNEIRRKNPEILYIDDQAKEGWSNIFQYIIYGSEKEKLFKFIQPLATDEIDESYFTNIVCPEIVKHKPDLILLDLRLKKESGIRTNVEELSGAVLLKGIRKQFPGIPVLMTTASNKSWSYEVLLRIGSDAYWTKEGVDIGVTEIDSVKNYIRFIELVNILTGEDYGFLKEYCNRIKKLEEKTEKHWWQSKNRFKKDELPEVESSFLYNILKDTSAIFREFLRSIVMKNTSSHVWNEWFYASLIIQNLGKIVEKLHYNGAEVGVRCIEYREDIFGKQLFIKRNEASHIEKVGFLTIKDAKEYMKLLLDYLNNRDNCPQSSGPKVVGRINLE